MVRTALYITFLVFSFLWAMIAFLKVDAVLGLDVEIGQTISEALVARGIPAAWLTAIGWTLMALTALFYLAGLFNIYANVKRAPWRTILFTTSVLITSIGLGFVYLQSIGQIERSSLNLIAVMVLPFTPAIVILPFHVTFAEYLGKQSSSKA